jgi:MFS transporter, DHA2 family, methylenomycin A resistance protein
VRFSGDRRLKVATIGSMCLAMFMVLLDNTVVNVALPSISEDVGSSVSGLQWIVNAYTLLFASLMLTAGTLGDLYGRKRVVLGGLGLFTLASVLCGLAPSVELLVAARALQGVGAAALLPTTLAIITATFPDRRERAQAIGIWAGVSALALAAGPVVGGVLVDSLGWQSIFFVNLPVGVAAYAVARRVVRGDGGRRPAGSGRRVDLPGQLLAVAALGSVTFALIEGPGRGWGSPLIAGLLAVAAVAGAAFLAVERRSPDPMLPLRLFRDRTFSAAVAVAGLAFFGVLSMLFFLSLFFQNVQGYSALETGLRFLPLEGAIVVVAPLAGRVAGRVGSRWLMAAGMGMAGAALLLLVRLQPGTEYAGVWWNLTLLGVGMGITMAPATAAIMGSVESGRAGVASAVSNTSRQVGAVFGIAVLGAVLASHTRALADAALAGLGVAEPARARLVTGSAEGLVAGGADLGGVDVEAVRQAVEAAYVSGLHRVLLLAGLALLVASALSAAFVRGAPAGTASRPPEVVAAA